MRALTMIAFPCLYFYRRIVYTIVDNHKLCINRAVHHGEGTEECFHLFKGGSEAAIARGIAFAPYADWCGAKLPRAAF